jgi:hypothetical protein
MTLQDVRLRSLPSNQSPEKPKSAMKNFEKAPRRQRAARQPAEVKPAVEPEKPAFLAQADSASPAMPGKPKERMAMLGKPKEKASVPGRPKNEVTLFAKPKNEAAMPGKPKREKVAALRVTPLPALQKTLPQQPLPLEPVAVKTQAPVFQKQPAPQSIASQNTAEAAPQARKLSPPPLHLWPVLGAAYAGVVALKMLKR